MWRLTYNVLLILVSPIILLVLLAKARCRPGMAYRLGLRDRSTAPHEGEASAPLIWVHAVSLGEVVAVTPLVKDLRRRHPLYRIIVSTVTETGREAVEQRLRGVAEHRYAPLDFPWVVSRVIANWRPSLYLFVETELWPNLLWQLKQRGIPTILVNGRISSRSFARQRVRPVRSFYRSMLQGLTVCLMQSERDVQRIIELGANPDRVKRIGNIKFDQPMPDGATSNGDSWRSLLQVSKDELVLIAGSTHPGEEEQVIAAYLMLVKEFPKLVLVLAPRHLERVAQVEALLRIQGISVTRRSTASHAVGDTPSVPRAVILDTRGELAALYQIGAVAFVGGTLVPIGGHNLLEPAVWGRPVFFGPHTDHCAEVADLLIGAGGGCRVAEERDLARQVASLLRDPARLAQMGDAAREVVKRNQGALQRCLDVVESVLSSRPVGLPHAEPGLALDIPARR